MWGNKDFKIRVDENCCTSSGVGLRLQCGLFLPSLMGGHTEYMDTDAASKVALVVSCLLLFSY